VDKPNEVSLDNTFSLSTRELKYIVILKERANEAQRMAVWEAKDLTASGKRLGIRKRKVESRSDIAEDRDDDQI